MTNHHVLHGRRAGRPRRGGSCQHAAAARVGTAHCVLQVKLAADLGSPLPL